MSAVAETAVRQKGPREMARSALNMLRGLAPSMVLEAFRADARWLASGLGAARNWDVFLAAGYSVGVLYLFAVWTAMVVVLIALARRLRPPEEET